jgi:nucleoside triphosphate diphosphatase
MADEPTSRSLPATLSRLDEITRRLRRECPWDREQDERSIVPHTVEEAYELADAAARGDDDRLGDELGDVLFQVYFLSLLLEERGAGSLEAVADGLIRKLVRRHPHVFGDEASEAAARVLEDRPARTADDVRGNWERIKREVEDDGTQERFRPIPETLPSLLYARKALKQAPDQDGEPLERAAESLDALADANGREAVESALGETLLAIVDAARSLGADPELALRAAAKRLDARSS